MLTQVIKDARHLPIIIRAIIHSLNLSRQASTTHPNLAVII